MPAHCFNGMNILFPPASTVLRGEAAAAFRPKGGHAAAVGKNDPCKTS